MTENNNDMVIAEIIYDAGSADHRTEIVTSYKEITEFVEKWMDVSTATLFLCGRTNDAHANPVSFFVLRENVKSINYLKVDGL